MMKHSYIKPMGLALLLLMSAMVAAQPSASTLPVQGKGAPDAPSTLTVDPALKVGTASTATASGYSDPDGDPFANWQYEWRSGANGTGTLLGSGASYTPVDTSSVYVRGRALASRGHPVEQQAGAWLEEVYTPVAAGPDFDAGCTLGTVSSGGLIYTCVLTQAEADANGVAYGSTFSENGKTYIRQNWSQGNTYCSNLGNGYRLPTSNELSTLYSAKGSMATYGGWPTSYLYWSSTVAAAGKHNYVNLFHGAIFNTVDVYNSAVSCVRSES